MCSSRAQVIKMRYINHSHLTETTCIVKVKYSCFMSGRLSTHTAFLCVYYNIVLNDCQLFLTILFGHTSHTITNRFFFVFCSQLFLELKCDFKALHTAITDAVYCVKLVVCDRRVANKLRKGLDKALHKS